MVSNRDTTDPPVGDSPSELPRGIDPLVEAELRARFEDECRSRLQLGVERYGPYNYLKPDVDLLLMIQEELVDIANYAEMLFVRIELMKRAGGINEMDVDRSE